MPDHTERHVGTRIREFRAIRDFSLAELGRLAHVSTSQLSRVENGEQPAGPSVLASVARALGVTLSVLHGQPYLHMLQKDQLDQLLAPRRNRDRAHNMQAEVARTTVITAYRLGFMDLTRLSPCRTRPPTSRPFTAWPAICSSSRSGRPTETPGSQPTADCAQLRGVSPPFDSRRSS
ncbi:helix-turn-helix domain-containing protein [Streptomyces sp. NPDC002514]|uniref:helix-turn-helix domain-containing protein n=1 Tax=Streptomyces sp. NPDC001270 TaxID=3364554 RepID=UPI0036A019BD